MSDYHDLRPRFACWLLKHDPAPYKGWITLEGSMFTRCKVYSMQEMRPPDTTKGKWLGLIYLIRTKER